jgi:hypothetical protein
LILVLIAYRRLLVNILVKLTELLNENSHPITVTATMKSQFDVQVRKPYLHKLIENLKERFPAVELISAFGILNPSEEWKHFKVFLAGCRSEVSTIKELAEFLLSTPSRRQLFPNMSELLVRGLLLPISTADCERGFSSMNRIKTSPRNRLKAKTLEQLMFISIEHEFNFDRAADHWGRRGNRRIHWQS